MDRNNRALKLPALKDQVPESPASPSENLPFPDVPAKLVIAIDGWAQTGKNTTGALVAEYLGGVLVDSGRFYRALTLACMEAGLQPFDQPAVAEWCKKAVIDVRLAKEDGAVPEATVAVNGRCFTKAELAHLGLRVSSVSSIPEVRSIVKACLRDCESLGRVVMLGRDIGGEVFPETPFKFFLNATEEVREQRHFQSTGEMGSVKRDLYDASNVMFTEDALMIDTSRITPEKVCGLILVEVFWRSSTMKSDSSVG